MIRLEIKNYNNRDAAKISALLYGNIDKYEYLTGEEILPSNQKQITEQAKFTYFPLEKAFEKQIKTIDEQGEKQMIAIKQPASINDYENKLLTSKEREIFKNIYNERINKIEELALTKKIDYNDLNFTVSSTDGETNFSGVKDSKTLLNDI